MKLKKIYIKNIRNIEELVIDCDDGVHLIYGENGQGKTSVIESISFLSNLRSFKDTDISSLLRFNEVFGSVRGIFQINENTHAELKVELIKGDYKTEKKAYVNQKMVKSVVDYFSVKLKHSPIQFHAINLNPTSTDLIRRDPQYRRNYLNQTIASENTEYLTVLKRYQKSIDQKSALLKQDGHIDKNLLNILNENIVKEGAFIHFSRLKYLEKLQDPIQNFMDQIAPKQRRIFLGYKMGEPLYFTRHFEEISLQKLMENLNQKLENFKNQERYRKSCLVGPHRDDVLFGVEGFLDNKSKSDLNDLGSQGEIRSFLLALKLSELDAFKKVTDVQPIMLIDDFSSELDQNRRSFLLNYLKHSDLQIFVTSTDHLMSEIGSKGKSIRMNQGQMMKVEL